MLKSLSFAALAGACLADPARDWSGYSFEAYVAEFGKQHKYGSQELPQRRQLFEASLDSVRAHNALNLSWTTGMNQFSDMTEPEKAAYKGYSGAIRGSQAPVLAGELPPASFFENLKEVKVYGIPYYPYYSCFALFLHLPR